jgi:DNA (cytosine-5)-methyltransferase 1
MLTFLSIADKRRPKWIVWENVPGVLSSNGGKDFGTFLGALGELGYGFAYRVLDAQFFGVAQRRRRVFVVGHLGDWRPAAAVLFESESLQRDSKPSRAKRQETPTDAQGSVGTTGNPKISNALCARDYKGPRPEADQGAPVIIEQVAQPIAVQGNLIGRTEGGPQGIGVSQDGSMYTLTKTDVHGVAQPQYFESHPNDSRVTGPHDVGNTVSARYGTGGGNTPIVSQPIAVDTYNYTTNANVSQTLRSEKSDTEHIGAILHPIPVLAGEHPKKEVTIDVCPTLPAAMGMGGGHTPLVPHPIAVDCFNQTINEKTSQTIGSSASDVNHYGAVLEPKAVDFRNSKIDGDVTMTLQSKPNGGYSVNYQPGVLQTMAIRRLTPVECEKLQGFPPNWTKIPYRNKPADQCPDGPRYKACGNSMAVPVMRWIGTRIQMIENYLNP